jgi:uncharacterized membrane protein YeaQ/YmgE (transglycosylase-associated protein family)
MDMPVNSIFGWVALGLIVGGCVWLINPDRGAIGWFSSLFAGVVGSVIGGCVAYALRIGADPYSPAGWMLAAIGAVMASAIFHSTAGIRRSA